MARTAKRSRPSNETSAVLRPILDAFCRGATRLFRNNVGLLYTTTGRPVAFGLGSEAGKPLAGTSDAIGFHSLLITPEMVGRTVAVFVAIEAKDLDDPKPHQEAFLLAVHRAGGIAGVARSVPEAAAILSGGPWLPPLGL
ncbi:MAG: hypothetical protein ACK5R2_13340 [Cyanobacteriota bacterium]